MQPTVQSPATICSIALALLALGCRDPPSAVGERVSVTTDVVEQVCRGTLEHLDAELARIEAELELEVQAELVEIHVVNSELIGEHCGPGRWACVVQPRRRLYVMSGVFNHWITRELIRDRIARTPAGGSKPLFFDGLGVALTRPLCEPAPSWAPPTVTQVVSARTNAQLGDAGRYLGGELTRWLLDTHGPAALLDFMAGIRAGDEVYDVRLAYLERFGSQLDVDLYAYWHPYEQPIDPVRAGCTEPEAPRDELGTRARFEATFDCDSPLVRNDFGKLSRVFVEWTLTVTSPGFFAVSGELPEGVEVVVEPCMCQLSTWTGDFSAPGPVKAEPGKDLWLTRSGVHRVRAYGPVGATVDLTIELDCDYALQNCPGTQQCTSQSGDGWPLGCCTPVCDTTADDPDCPAALPNCEPFDEGLVGRCHP